MLPLTNVLMHLIEDGTSSRSRKGTVRNTDSFFKDESVETRKINLTPSLLRDDSNAPPQQNFEPEVTLTMIRTVD